MKDKNKNTWWKPALTVFAQMSGWVAGPIVIALFLGKYLDTKFETTPWIFISLTGFSFFISCFGIVRVAKNYMKEIENENKNNGEHTNN